MTNAMQAVLDKAARAEAPAEKMKPPRKPATPVAAKVAVEQGADVSTEAAPARQRQPRRPSREDRRFVAGHFDPAVVKQLRMIAVEDETTVQALLEEALDLLFIKKGRQKVADISKRV